MKLHRPEIVQQLAERIRQMESKSRPIAATIPLVGRGLASLFPDGQLPAGSVVEMFAGEGGAAWTLALQLARSACGDRKRLFVGDQRRSCYPPALLKYGFAPGRIVLVRSTDPSDVLSAVAQSLTCSAIGAALGWFERVTAGDYRRLQLAAESHGGVGIVMRPPSARREPSLAGVRWLVEPLPAGRSGRQVRIEVLRVRGGCAGQTAVAEIDDASGAVRVLSGMASATPAAKSALRDASTRRD